MPLRIEEGVNITVVRSKKSELLSGFLDDVAVLPVEMTPAPGQPNERLGVRTIMQVKEMWCWAACAEMVLRFFGASLDKCNVAGLQLNRDCCNSVSADCDMGLSVEEIDQAFANVHLAGRRFEREITFDDIRNQISGTPPRPVVAGIRWAGGGGHLVVVSGWRIADSLRFVKVNDPFYTSGDIRYEDLVQHYGPNDTGVWAHTWTDLKRV
jgi:Papain-like cysteine protease AvrRpt2